MCDRCQKNVKTKEITIEEPYFSQEECEEGSYLMNYYSLNICENCAKEMEIEWI